MSQEDRVIDYLEKNGSITSMDAIYHLGIMDLPKRISELIRKGTDINKQWESGRNRYGEPIHYMRYSLGGRN